MERRFRLADAGTNILTELRAGVATFLTMAYIIVVNLSMRCPVRSCGRFPTPC